MRLGDKQVGAPEVVYKDTKADIEALADIEEGAFAYATDTHEPGWFDGAAWQWGAGSNRKYRQFLYTVVGGAITFLTDTDGNPLTVLLDTE